MSRTLTARVAFPAEVHVEQHAPKPRDKLLSWYEVATGQLPATHPIERLSRYFDRYPELQVAALTTSPKNWQQFFPARQSILEELQNYAAEAVRATHGVHK